MTRGTCPKVAHRARIGSRLLLATALGALLTLPGCIERALEVRTNPPGALVVIDGEEAGTTPVTQTFLHYGTHEFIFSKEGYRRKKLLQEVRPPWYEEIPLDFFVEMVWPFTVTDGHVYSYDLEPIIPVEKKAFVERAEELRKRSKEPGAAE
jgi:hypothetical protein